MWRLSGGPKVWRMRAAVGSGRGLCRPSNTTATLSHFFTFTTEPGPPLGRTQGGTAPARPTSRHSNEAIILGSQSESTCKGTKRRLVFSIIAIESFSKRLWEVVFIQLIKCGKCSLTCLFKMMFVRLCRAGTGAASRAAIKSQLAAPRS